MPGMSGLEVAGRLRRAGSTVPIVFLTIHDDEELVLATQAAGGIGYVVKTPAAVGSRRRGQRSVRRPALRLPNALNQFMNLSPRGGRIGSTATLVLLVFLICLPATAFSQGAVAGVVTDATGGVLPRVNVDARSPALIEKIRTTVTDAAGQYRIENLRPGLYSVTFRLDGWSPSVHTDIEVAGSSTVTVDAQLRLGTLSDAITVTGGVPLIDVHSSKREVALSGDIVKVGSDRSQLQRACSCSCRASSPTPTTR